MPLRASGTRMPSTSLLAAPQRWHKSCSCTEFTLHQLSPYIGKIKSVIAKDLIEKYTSPGDLVVDPFAGAGTIPYEAAIIGRRVLAADISPYARVLSLAKLRPPASLESALKKAQRILARAGAACTSDTEAPPLWVRQFFHPRTLTEALAFSAIARTPGNEFFMACLLGILHHQRPGFLSYPSSHLVPYLRDRKYPRRLYPELYTYRELGPRLLAKIGRAFRRYVIPDSHVITFRHSAIEKLQFPPVVDAVITSPPYMNALDYGRDNRLRLWFIDPELARHRPHDRTRSLAAFVSAITALATKVEKSLRVKGHCVLIVGDHFSRSFDAWPSQTVIELMRRHAPSLKLLTVLADIIPDVRRTRRECSAVKTEHFLIFRRQR